MKTNKYLKRFLATNIKNNNKAQQEIFDRSQCGNGKISVQVLIKFDKLF